GVKAGTVITNQATLNFIVGDSASYSIRSNEVKSLVDQVLDFVLEWQDSEPIEIYEGAKQKVLTLSLLNTGNGKDDISLSFVEDGLFSSSIESIELFVDVNSNGTFDSDDKTLSSVSLDADISTNLFLVTSLKDDINITAEYFDIEVKAKSLIGGSGVKGTLYEGKGVDGVDAIDGINGAIASEKVTYHLFTQTPVFTKTVRYFDSQEYYLVSLDLNIQGNSDLKNIHLEDSVPRGLVYRKNSIRFKQELQTDKKDSDFAYFDFNINSLALDLPSTRLPKQILVTYILDKEVR
ncbi:MAG: hypothetical protein GXO30_05005, partial [Epsilonproteobacteria bacterium]|nr:hypothetical protein [Campylobacterota bacterium]